jgi:hypothetical protein
MSFLKKTASERVRSTTGEALEVGSPRLTGKPAPSFGANTGGGARIGINQRKEILMGNYLMECACFPDHMKAKAPWTCPCPCHDVKFFREEGLSLEEKVRMLEERVEKLEEASRN